MGDNREWGWREGANFEMPTKTTARKESKMGPLWGVQGSNREVVKLVNRRIMKGGTTSEAG